MNDLENQAAEALEDTQTGRYLTFSLGDETYGIEIRHVTEIVGMQAVTQMPEMPDYIRGIINLRGLIIPLLDVRLRFGKPPRPYDDRTCVVVIDLSGVAVGLIVDGVSEVRSIAREDVVELPALNMGPKNGFVGKIGKPGGHVVLLLDCEKLLSPEELAHVGEL